MHYFWEWHSGILSQIPGWKTDFMRASLRETSLEDSSGKVLLLST